MTPPLQQVASTRGVVALVFVVMAATYVIPMVVPDPSLAWAAEDEVCCHVPAILAIQREGVGTAVTDYTFYRSATTPLYHMIMSVVLGRVDPVLIRAIWIAVAFTAGALFYRLVATDLALRQPHRAALALSAAFLLSPTIRAAAIYFVTDGLAAALAIAALVALRRAQMGSDTSVGWSILAVVLASATFYTRQYYLWVTLYVAASLFFGSGSTSRIKVATISSCVLLAMPAVALFRLWHGFTPPLGFAVHTDPALLSTVPNLLGLMAIYTLPLAWAAYRDDRAGGREAFRSNPAAWLLILGAMLVLVAAGLAFGLEIPEAGGILRPLGRFGRLGRVTFLFVSSMGVLMLARWLIVDGRRQLWWFVFLAPLLAGSIVLQRYVEPAILVFMFLVARPADALKVLDSRLVWFYPLFTAAYALSRTIHFASNL